MGRTKTSSTRRVPEDQLRPYLLRPAGPISWVELFGNDRAVELEVGSGKGLFLVSAAAQFPDRNFLGIEIARKWSEFTAGRLATRALLNARVAQADARRVLGEWVADGSVRAVHVYFPDPWWKRRHRKRRVFDARFLADVVRVLEPAGTLRVASDVSEYFEQMGRLCAARPELSAATEPSEPTEGFDYLTNFERKYRAAGRTIQRAQWIKR